jgi:uncharacterized RDD family membrane protein YckC
MVPPAAPVDASLQGHYAGFVSRGLSFGVDVLVISVVFDLGAHAFEYLFNIVTGASFQFADHTVLADVVLVLWGFFYMSYSLSHFGRTVGMALFALRAVRADGADLGPGRAMLRTLVFPLSLAFLLIGFLPILLGKQRRALHDLIAGTAIVYSWDTESAHFRFLARRRAEPARAAPDTGRP